MHVRRSGVATCCACVCRVPCCVDVPSCVHVHVVCQLVRIGEREWRQECHGRSTIITETWYVMSCHVMSCHVMSCDAMRCDVICDVIRCDGIREWCGVM